MDGRNEKKNLSTTKDVDMHGLCRYAWAQFVPNKFQLKDELDKDTGACFVGFLFICPLQTLELEWTSHGKVKSYSRKEIEYEFN